MTDAARLARVAFGVAYRVLGDPSDAEDIAQDAMARWLGIDRKTVATPAGYIASIAARLALNRLRDTQHRRRLLSRYGLPVPIVAPAADEQADARLDLSFGLVVLSRALTPFARAVFVLRHSFNLGFDEIAAALGSTAGACRQADSRARRRLLQPRDSQPGGTADADASLIQKLIDLIGKGDIEGLTRLLAEDVRLTTDGGGRGPALRRPIAGGGVVARLLIASPALLTGQPHPRIVRGAGGPVLVVAVAGKPVLIVAIESAKTRIRSIYVLSDPRKLARLQRQP